MENFTNEEKDYYELLVDMLDDGVIDESERNILNKRKGKYGISDERAKEIEDFAKREYLESKTPQFETDGEKDYYELLVDMLDDGVIDESERNILNKRKEKYQISDERAKELENIASNLFENATINTGNYNTKGILNDYNINIDDNDKECEVNYKFIDKIKENIKAWEVKVGHSFISSWDIETSIYERYREDLVNASKINKVKFHNEIKNLLKGIKIDYYYPFKCYKEFKKIYKLHEKGYLCYPKEYFLTALQLLEQFNSMEKYECVIGIGKTLLKQSFYNKYILRTMGVAYYNIKNLGRALRTFYILVIIDNEDDYSWFLLADAYSNLEDYYNAIYCYETAININNSVAVYWNDYGVALANLNRMEEAKNAYKKAAELDPNEKLYRDNVNKSTVRKIVKGIGDLFK